MESLLCLCLSSSRIRRLASGSGAFLLALPLRLLSLPITRSPRQYSATRTLALVANVKQPAHYQKIRRLRLWRQRQSMS